MRIQISSVVVVSILGLAAACGDDDIVGGECGPGTVLDEDGTCVIEDSGDPTTRIAPSGGQIPAQSAVTLVADEPATIYYTIDGSEPDTDSPSGESPVIIQGLPVDEGEVTVRFFARDDDGNSESPKMASFTLDVAPGAVSGLTVAVTGTDSAVSWTPPTDDDLVGVVVAKVDGVITSPARGQTVAVDDELGPGTTVVYVGTDTSYAGADLAPGFHQYAVWAYDSWGNYSRVRTAGDQVALPAQTGTITVDVGAETATVSAPSHVAVAVGTVDFDDAVTVTVPVTLTNGAGRAVYNTKIAITDVSGSAAGAVSGNDGTIGDDSDPYYYVSAGLEPGGASEEEVLTLTNVVNTETIVITFSVLDHPLVVGPPQWNDDDESGQLFDSGTDQFVGDEGLADLSHMANQVPPSYYGGGVSLDGRRLYVGGRQANHLAIIDLATMEEVAQSASLATGKGIALWPVLLADEDVVYTAVTQGTHAYEGYNQGPGSFPRRFFLVKLDASTLEELGRVELVSALGEEDFGRVRTFALSSDRTMAAMGFRDDDETGTSGEVHLVDLATMTAIDTDSATEGVQPIDEVPCVPSLVFSPNGEKLYVGNTWSVADDDIRVVDLTSATYDVTTVAVPHGGGTAMSLGPDGLIYVGSHGQSTGLWTIDPADDTVDDLANYSRNVAAMAWDSAGTLWTIPGYAEDEVCHVDLTDDGTETCITGDGSSHYGHWIAITPF